MPSHDTVHGVRVRRVLKKNGASSQWPHSAAKKEQRREQSTLGVGTIKRKDWKQGNKRRRTKNKS
jgi:hypothetical protein